jgi:hypothetical protein
MENWKAHLTSQSAESSGYEGNTTPSCAARLKTRE